MATAADKAKAKALAKGCELADELLALHRKHADLFGQMDSLKASLIAVATEVGESFKEVFDKKGTVSVSGAKAAEFKGNVPEVVPTLFNALTAAAQKKLTDTGVITIVPSWSKANHGRVTVKVF